MVSNAPKKIIVVGGPEGKLSAVFSKLAALHKKNNFTVAIIVGNLFAVPRSVDSPDVASGINATDSPEITGVTPPTNETAALLAGSITIPVPTYFTVGLAPLPAPVASILASGSNTLCENLHYIPNGTVAGHDGVRIVAFGNRQLTKYRKSDASASSVESLTDVGSVAPGDGADYKPLADDILQAAVKADVLISAVWPRGIWNNSNAKLSVPSPATTIPSSQGLADAVLKIKPRYHFAFSFSGGDFFFEREPFKSDPAASPTGTTRFVSLAAYGNLAHAKAMYAFNLSPETPGVVVPPAESLPRELATANPLQSLHSGHKRSLDEFATGDFQGQTRFDMDRPNHRDRRAAHDDDDAERPHRRRRRRVDRDRAAVIGPDTCFFCLGNPNLSEHLCCSIGNESYVTVAKGPLTTSTAYKDLNLRFPGHLLIIPLAHKPCIAAIGSGDENDPLHTCDAGRTLAEMNRFLDAIRASIATASVHALGVVTWEISRSDNVHHHWQLLAVPIGTILQGLVAAAFKVEAENSKYPPFVDEAADLAVLESQQNMGDFFRVRIWSDDGSDRITGQSLVMPLDAFRERAGHGDRPVRFDVQFGRRVMAKLLGLESRMSWKDCAQSQAEEEADVAAFRDIFSSYDFSTK